MLEIIELTKKYGKTLAVDNVSFMVPDGQIGILLGPNGAGKSTIIKSIAGLVRYSGQVRIKGIPAKTEEAKSVFAYVPEIPAMYEALTVREHLEFILKAYRTEASEEELQTLLARFELLDKQDKLGNELSKGMMQKVSICCALIVHPQVILLDEPMVGLDPAAIKELKNVILELRAQGTTVLISTHMLEMVKELWDVTYVMEKGRIIGAYSKEQVGAENLEELFFKLTSPSGQETAGINSAGTEASDADSAEGK